MVTYCLCVGYVGYVDSRRHSIVSVTQLAVMAGQLVVECTATVTS